MAYLDFRDFLDKLERKGDLHRVRVEVDPVLEIAEIADRVSKMADGGKALYFEKVKGSRFPVAVNSFGSYRRACFALETGELHDLSRRLTDFLDSMPAGDNASWWRHLGIAPRMTDRAAFRDIVDFTPNLDEYPFLTCWPYDSGRAITLPLVCTRDQETGEANYGIYRVQVTGPTSAAIHWRQGSDGWRHWQHCRERGERMPVAIVVGGDPALTFSAFFPLPQAVDEMRFAGLLRNSPVELARCQTSDLLVPANVELVIEGFVEPDIGITGSAFGNHTGFYVPAPDAALLRVTCVSRRKEPVIPATVVGRPPMEDCWLAKAAERLMLPFIRRELPEITDINLPLEWIFHNSAIVAINKTSPGQAFKVMQSLRSGRWLRNARVLIVVDAEMNVQDISNVAWRVVNTVDWRNDLVVSEEEARQSAAGSLPGSGAVLGVDATRKWPEELAGRSWPREIAQDETIRRLVAARWHEYGF